MLSPTPTTRGLGGALILALLLAACGGASHKAAPATPAKTSTTATTPAPTATSRLSEYLLREGEGGFEVFSTPVVQPTIASWVTVSRSTAADGRRVRTEGFGGALEQATATRSGGTGLDFVLEVASAAAARREEAVELGEDIAEQGHVHVMRFTVPGIPGSQGIAAVGGKRGSAANVLFTEGRCLLLVGNGQVGSSYRAPVIAGAQALYRRSIAAGGACTPTGPAQV